MKIKHYNKTNVYEATQERMEYLFSEFDKVLVAFSGGKDSGTALNIAYDYAKEHELLDKLSMFHVDYEAQYSATTEYVTHSFEDDFEGIGKYWLCLPCSAQCAVSMTQDRWIPWDSKDKEIWAREMPDSKFVINEDNVEFKFKKGDWDYDMQEEFGRWFAEKNGRTAVIVAIRTDESLHRMSAISNKNKRNQYKGSHWIIKDTDSDVTFKAYPIYDWHVEDIWTYHAKTGHTYNKLYDLFYYAGVSLHDMRVASPFNDCAIDSLKLYKVVEPQMWAKLVGRVNGVNFAGIYGGTTAMGWKSIKLPKGHTWKSYLEFLLATLPAETRERYLKKFNTSIKFWKERGGVLDEITIEELKKSGVEFEIAGKTNYKTDKLAVRFDTYPDDADVTDFKSVPSYKRMCVCIMKNDHMCKYMGFAQTKAEKEKRNEMIKKYRDIVRGK